MISKQPLPTIPLTCHFSRYILRTIHLKRLCLPSGTATRRRKLMRVLVPVGFLCAVLSCAPLARCDDEHHHALTAEEVGSVHFATSCSKSVALSFNRAVALLHSFQYEQAREAFSGVASGIPSARWLNGAWPCLTTTVCGRTGTRLPAARHLKKQRLLRRPIRKRLRENWPTSALWMKFTARMTKIRRTTTARLNRKWGFCKRLIPPTARPRSSTR